MLIFFGVSVGFLAIWGAMFASQIYRFMFNTWSFFGTMSITACLLLITVLGLSVYAFLNFGLGLPEYCKFMRRYRNARANPYNRSTCDQGRLDG